MGKYIFLTQEGFTYQPESKSDTPDIENLQVIGFSIGKNSDEAFNALIEDNLFLKETNFTEIFCYKLDDSYENTKKIYCLK